MEYAKKQELETRKQKRKTKLHPNDVCLTKMFLYDGIFKRHTLFRYLLPVLALRHIKDNYSEDISDIKITVFAFTLSGLVMNVSSS